MAKVNVGQSYSPETLDEFVEVIKKLTANTENTVVSFNGTMTNGIDERQHFNINWTELRELPGFESSPEV